MNRFPVLGTPVHYATYQSALEEVIALAGRDAPAAVSACNTHIITLARSDPGFAKVMRRFDLVLPDGYPLVWQLNRHGTFLQDRVYGPYFMRHVLRHTPRPFRHFFFGATEECLEKLRKAAEKEQPDIEIAGTLSPPYRTWTEQEEAGFAKQIAASGADFIWVALGGGRQERWIVDNLSRHRRGVFFAIGDAFALLVGNRPFAPKWMQKSGLTWLYRLWQEPRRLLPRYLKYNTLFLYYLMRDRLLGTPEETRRPRIAFLGTRGVPAKYSGFEVVVEELGCRLAENGYDVTVYNRYPHCAMGRRSYKGMRIITLPTIPTKNLDTIVHTSLSALDAIFRGYDLVYLCGVGNAIFTGFLQCFGIKVVINVDGPDFRRAKWGMFGRQWLKMSESLASKLGGQVIADNREIVGRYQRDYGITPDYISYGCELRNKKVECGELAKWGLVAGGYALHVSRLSPENETDLLLAAWRDYRGPLRLVITGAPNYEVAYYRRLQKLADERVIFTGARFGDSYLELSQNALFFVMPAAIEATRVVLIDQLSIGQAILYKDSPASREVLGDAGEPFHPLNAAASLTERMEFLSANPDHCRELGNRALARAEQEFRWEKIVARYEKLFQTLLPPGISTNPCAHSPSSPPR